MEIKITIVICVVSAAAVLILCTIWILRREKGPKSRGGELRPVKTGFSELCLDENKENYRIQTAPETFVRIGKVHEVGKRKDQQDTLAYSDVQDENTVRQNGILLVVADGMGGLAHGAEISSLTAVEMLRYFDVHNMMDRPAEALKEALLYANGKVNAFLGGQRLGAGGSTVVAVMIQNHKVYWISVGDSSIFFCHEERMERLNTLHNYETELQRKVELGEMAEEEAAGHPQRAALTSFIGQGEPVLIDRNTEALTLTAGDYLILATDGICETVSMKELEQITRFGAQEAAQRLRHLVESRNKRSQDNYTAVIVEDCGG